MEFKDWEPLYLDILRDFGFSREEDEEAARVLAALAKGKRLCADACLSSLMQERVTVCGDAPNLRAQLKGHKPEGTLIAADGATSVLLEAGMLPDIIVSDLDGEMEAQIKANSLGAIMVVHAHGDNIDRLGRFIPRLEGMLVLTTQSRSFGAVRNYGGFTDGDRAVIMARHFGAKHFLLLGFDFEDPRPKIGRDRAIKLRKLAWARRLIFDLNPDQVVLSTP